MVFFEKIAKDQGKRVGRDGSQGGQHQTDSKIAQRLDEIARQGGFNATVAQQTVRNLLGFQSKTRQDKTGKYDPNKTIEFPRGDR